MFEIDRYEDQKSNAVMAMVKMGVQKIALVPVTSYAASAIPAKSALALTKLANSRSPHVPHSTERG